jgi:hypothetical protein
MELLVAGVGFVQEHGTELSVVLGGLRLAVDVARGMWSLLRRLRANRAPGLRPSKLSDEHSSTSAVNEQSSGRHAT